MSATKTIPAMVTTVFARRELVTARFFLGWYNLLSIATSFAFAFRNANGTTASLSQYECDISVRAKFVLCLFLKERSSLLLL